jgi:holo-[acyl-carrier protein] synthase
MNVVGVGIDAVDVGRYRRVLARRPGVAERTFTADELAYARRHSDPTQRLAARFAAKEAAMKALGVGLGACRLQDLEVVRDDDGRPSLVLHGAAAELARGRGVATMAISMTHTDTVASAIVLALSSVDGGPRWRAAPTVVGG